MSMRESKSWSLLTGAGILFLLTVVYIAMMGETLVNQPRWFLIPGITISCTMIIVILSVAISDSPVFVRGVIAMFLGIPCLIAATYFFTLAFDSISTNIDEESVEVEIPITVKNKEYVKITAAHIPSTDFPNMTRVFVDDEKDLAVYIDTTYQPSVPDVDTEVVFVDGSIGVVVDVDKDGFYVKQDKNTVTHGFSGTEVVTDSSKYLGFVSSMDKDGIIYCVAY